MAGKKKHRLTFTDVENTGLFGDPPNLDEAIKLDRQIIDYAFLVWEDGNYVKSFEQKVMPSTPQALDDAKACAAGGFNKFEEKQWFRRVAPNTYEPAKPWSLEDCDNARGYLEGATLAGSNPNFDFVMYKAEFFRQVKAFPELGTHRKMNTGDLAWPLVAAGLVEKTGLETLAAFLGVEHQAHTAMGDVKACVKVYEILCERFIHSPRKLRELCAAIIPGLEPKSDRAEARELLNAIVVM